MSVFLYYGGHHDSDRMSVLVWSSRLESIVQSRLSTTRPVITLIGCNAVGRASRFFGRYGVFFGFFNLYIFFYCKLLYLLCTLPRCTFTTMAIVYLFVSVTSTLVTLLKQQRANGDVCLASTVIDRRQWLAEHRQKPTCLGHQF